jgi:predicted ABC-type ATPase
LSQPKIIIIAGPNGAGKTTFAREYLPFEGDCLAFINADLIAAGLSPFAPEKAAIQAGRLMLESIAAHVAQRMSFAFETTLSGLGYARQIPQWREEGWWVELIFLSLPSADVAVERVAQRVRQGGHDIPEPTIRRRYSAGQRLFESTYKPLVDQWSYYENAEGIPVLMDSDNQQKGSGAMEPEATYGADSPSHPDPHLRGVLDAMRRAALRAREVARQTGTDLILARDGKVIRVKPTQEPSPL